MYLFFTAAATRKMNRPNIKIIVNFRYVDYVFIMAYDYTPTTSSVTGLLAPLSSIVSKKSVFFDWLVWKQSSGFAYFSICLSVIVDLKTKNSNFFRTILSISGCLKVYRTLKLYWEFQATRGLSLSAILPKTE